MLTSKVCVSGVVPKKQLAVVNDDAKTWKDEQIINNNNSNNQGKEWDYGTECVCLCGFASSCEVKKKGNNWSKKKHFEAEMKCRTEGQNVQFIGSFIVSKYLQLF